MDKQVSKTQYSFEKTFLIRDIEIDTDCVLWEERRTRDMHKKEDIAPKSTFNVKHNNKVKLFYQPN